MTSNTSTFQDPITKQNRAYALDALRGFAILTMVLSGAIPYGSLPTWMYHAQVPPPDHVFNAKIAGITWVDLVFPFFLFSMGAAIPLALSRRKEQGFSKGRITLAILYRGLLLGLFAVYMEHLSPWNLNPHPTAKTWITVLFGWLLLFPIFVRLPKNWHLGLRLGIKIFGWLAAILLMMSIRFPDGSGFSWHRSDIIIVILTNVAVFGSLIWLITKNNILLRLAFLGPLFAFRLSHNLGGWVQWISEYSPKFLNWVYHFGMLQYLFIVIPGTIIGDLLLKWMKTPTNSQPAEHSAKWSTGHYFNIAFLMLAFNLLLLIGLFNRVIWQTALAAGIYILIGLFMFRNPNTNIEKLMKQLFSWGVYWLIVGLIFEKYENGIKKDPNTMSYFFDTTALAIFLLIAFMVIIDIWKKKWLQLLVFNGQNPMIAYRGNTNLVIPLVFLTKFDWVLDKIEQFFRNLIAPSPWIGFCRGFLMTLLVAYIVSIFSKKNIFWRT